MSRVSPFLKCDPKEPTITEERERLSNTDSCSEHCRTFRWFGVQQPASIGRDHGQGTESLWKQKQQWNHWGAVKQRRVQTKQSAQSGKAVSTWQIIQPTPFSHHCRALGRDWREASVTTLGLSPAISPLDLSRIWLLGCTQLHRPATPLNPALVVPYPSLSAVQTSELRVIHASGLHIPKFCFLFLNSFHHSGRLHTLGTILP